uniref:Permatin n=1 Tax=Oryza sativa subsp. japonica TaxID=39947 RepID=Q6Z0J6_ORYSJ|nr:putative permatin precursor [Oryza sativa Japonica Group]
MGFVQVVEFWIWEEYHVGGGAHGRLLRRRGRCVTGDCASVLSCSVSGEPPRCPSTRLHARLLTRRRRRLPRPVACRRVNVPVSFQTTNGGGARCSKGRGPSCAVDIMARYVPPRAPCPRRLRQCVRQVRRGDTYCYRGQFEASSTSALLALTDTGLCPDAYSYAKDDQTSTFTCPAGTNHRVDFCPPTSGVTAGDDDGHGLPRLSCQICVPCASAAMVMVLLPPPATASRRELPNFRGFGVGLPPTSATVKTGIELPDCAAAATVLLPPPFTASRGASWWRLPASCGGGTVDGDLTSVSAGDRAWWTVVDHHDDLVLYDVYWGSRLFVCNPATRRWAMLPPPWPEPEHEPSAASIVGTKVISDMEHISHN